MTKTKTVKKKIKAEPEPEKGELIPIEMTAELDSLPIRPVSKLSVPLIASYLTKNRTQADIAAACNISRQAVSDYIQRHSSELEPLLDTEDSFLALQCKAVASKAAGLIDLHLDSTTKRDLNALGIILGITTEKYRLLQNKSTANIQSLSKIIASADYEFLAALTSNKADN